MEKISVILPVNNVAPYLRQGLDSLCCQTIQEMEIIIVDDGSSDGSAEICDEYASAHSNITVIHKKNGGVSSARNVGIQMAQGTYIAFVDPDDYVHPAMMEKLYVRLKADAAEICICDFQNVDESGKITRDPYRMNHLAPGVYTSDQALDALFLQQLTSHLWNKLFYRELFENITFPEGRRYEDIAVMYLLFEKAKRISKLPDVLYYYRNRSSSITRTPQMHDVDDALYIIQLVQRHYQEVPRQPEGLNEFYCGILSNAYLLALHTGADDSLLNRIRDEFMRHFHHIGFRRAMKNPYYFKFILLKLNLTKPVLKLKMAVKR